MIPLIDADIVCYRAGHAASNGDYLMNIEYVDNIMYSILDRFETRDYKAYLTGKNNFRYEVATLQPYKGTRDKSKRPPHYKNIREYLTETWGAEVTQGCEADDVIGEQQGEGTVICSVDKDFRTIPGNFFHIATGNLEYITEEEAKLNFWVQMLIGDTSDNIPGIKNPAKAHHKNPPNFTDGTARESMIAPYHQTVLELYRKQYGERCEEIFHEIATLLFIQRKDAKTYKECNYLFT